MKKTFFYFVTTIVILVIVVLAWQYVKQSSQSPEKKSIVVLPFSSDIADSISVDLTPEEEQLLGKSRTIDSLAYDAYPKGYRCLVDSLSDVNIVVESSITDKNDSLEIQIQILDETGDQIWTKSYMSGKNELPEIFNKIQQDISETINHKNN